MPNLNKHMNDIAFFLSPDLKEKKKKKWPSDPHNFQTKRGKQTFYFLGLNTEWYLSGSMKLLLWVMKYRFMWTICMVWIIHDICCKETTKKKKKKQNKNINIM